MNGVYFSASMLGFIPEVWKTDGTYINGQWPEDAVLLTESESATYWKQNPPVGKKLSSEGNRPVWADIPPLSHDEQVLEVESKKQQILMSINAHTQIWQTQLSLEMISDEERALLIQWMKYAQEVNAVDSSAPVWPAEPAK